MTKQYYGGLTSAEVATYSPYIYCIYSHSNKSLYIGETRAKLGALGRLSQHFSYTDSATFRKRICEVFGYSDVAIGEVAFTIFRLSKKKSFWSDYSEYRQAVEDEVQKEVIEFINERKYQIAVVSRTSPNPAKRVQYVQEEVNNILGKLTQWISDTHTSINE